LSVLKRLLEVRREAKQQADKVVRAEAKLEAALKKLVEELKKHREAMERLSEAIEKANARRSDLP